MALHVSSSIASMSMQSITMLFGERDSALAPAQRAEPSSGGLALHKGSMYERLAALYSLPGEDRAAAAEAVGGALKTAFQYVEASPNKRAVVAGIRQHAEDGRAWDGTVRLGGSIQVLGSNATPEQAESNARQLANLFDRMVNVQLRLFMGSGLGSQRAAEGAGQAARGEAPGSAAEPAEGGGIQISPMALDNLPDVRGQARDWLMKNGVNVNLVETSEGDKVLEYSYNRTFSSMDYTYGEHSVTVAQGGRWEVDKGADGWTLAPSMHIHSEGWQIGRGTLLDLSG